MPVNGAQQSRARPLPERRRTAQNVPPEVADNTWRHGSCCHVTSDHMAPDIGHPKERGPGGLNPEE